MSNPGSSDDPVRASSITGSFPRVGGPRPAADRPPLHHRLEDAVLAAVLAAMVVLPLVEIVTRGRNVPSTILVVQHLTLWLGLLGAGLATRAGRHLAIAPIAEQLRGKAAVVARVVSAGLSAVVAVALVHASVELLAALKEGAGQVAGVPEWCWAAALPVGFGIVALRRLFRPAVGTWKVRLAAFGFALAVGALAFLPAAQREALMWPGILVLVGAALIGMPLFALIGGAALLLFMGSGEPLAAVPNAYYGLIVSSPMLPTIPLFTLAGYVLAEGGASKRLVRLFRALFGWLPGGLAIAAAVVCAFFTTFTGGSGVTILALGGLLLPTLVQSGYRERYSIGLLTTSGSLGLLFPPSVPVILYGVVSQTRIDRLFAGALLPGILLVAAVALTGQLKRWRGDVARAPFEIQEALAAMWAAKWEFMLPAVVLGGLFGGIMTPLEAAALTAAYAILVETVIHRDLHPIRQLPGVLVNTAALIGGVFTILGVAVGLTSFLVDAEVPLKAVDWVRQGIDSRLGFLLALNVFLLLVGCLMDIFSAIVVVVPIITPIAIAYGVDPIHLGVIFIANLELGYLTPPVGLNLFLASFRFDRELLSIYRATIPFFLILLVMVIAITYIPALTGWGVALLAQWVPSSAL